MRVQDAALHALNIISNILVVAILDIHRGRENSRGVWDSLRLDHVLDNSAYSLCALYKLAAEPLVSLSHVTFIEVIVTVRVGDTAHKTVANSDQKKRVEHQIVHNCSVRYLCLVVPLIFRSYEVECWEDSTVNHEQSEDNESSRLKL